MKNFYAYGPSELGCETTWDSYPFFVYWYPPSGLARLKAGPHTLDEQIEALLWGPVWVASWSVSGDIQCYWLCFKFKWLWLHWWLNFLVGNEEILTAANSLKISPWSKLYRLEPSLVFFKILGVSLWWPHCEHMSGVVSHQLFCHVDRASLQKKKKLPAHRVKHRWEVDSKRPAHPSHPPEYVVAFVLTRHSIMWNKFQKTS